VTAEPNTIPPLTAPDEQPAMSGEHFSGGLVDQRQTRKKQTLRLWLWRLRALLLVTVCATFGVLLLILPWTPKWTDNPLLLTSPDLRRVISSGFVRGMSSGLGVLDLWLGFWEAIHYHESPR
jgi:hypothetical protein